MNVVGYIRVSTPGQAREGESLKTQREAIERYAEEKRYKLIGVYSDEGISGSKNDRPALTTLLGDGEKRKFELVVIHRLSRFGRNARDLLNNIEILKNNGIKVVSIKDGMDYSNPYGQAMLTMLAAIAQLERDINDEQMKENKMSKWRERRTIIGKLPYGYCWDDKNTEIKILDKEAKIYQRMASIYLDEGKSFSSIAADLNKDNIKPRLANRWTSSVISYILKNPIYYGHYVVNQTKYDGKKRTKEKKPEGEHIIWDLDEPLRLISKSRWDLIQKKTEFNKSKGKYIKISEDYFLRDVLECGECGGVIKPRHGNEKKDKSRLRYYACYWRWTSERELEDKGKRRCGLSFVKADVIEDYVWYYITSYLSLQRLTNRTRKKTPYDEIFDSKEYEYKIQRLLKIISELECEIKKNGRSKERLYSLLEDEKDHKDEFLRKLRDISDRMITLTSKKNEIMQEIKELQEIKQNDRLYKEFLANRNGFIKDLIKSLHRLSPQDKKVLVEGMLREKIRIYAGNGENPWDPNGLKVRFNKEILVRLMDEEKINILDKDTRHPLREHRFAAPGGARQ